jgi:hypothetical protein
MGVINEIVVPLPPDLLATVDGAATKGQAYALTMPTVATEPMTVTGVDGQVFTARPTELVYSGKDAAGVRAYDYYVGSAPSTVTTNGRQARYGRVFPKADDVYVAQREGVKHYTILQSAPRLPADYLVNDVEFGVSSLIGGVPLPPGRHEHIEAWGFTLPRPFATDLAGAKVYGECEVVDGDAGQQLFVWFDAAWFADSERVYPVTIDPTILSTTVSSTTTRGNRMVKLPSSARRVAFVSVAGGVAVKVSDDYGQTWQTCTTPASGIISTNTAAVVAADADNDDAIHVLIGGTVTSTSTLDYHRVTVSGLTATSVTTQVEAAATGFSWWMTGLVVHSGAVGTTKNLIFIYHKKPETVTTEVLYTRSATATTAGVLTLGTRYTLDSGTDARYVAGISKRLDGACKVLYQNAKGLTTAGFVRVANVTAPMTIAPPQTTVAAAYYYLTGYVSAIDGLDSCMWLGETNTALVLWDEIGSWKTISGTTYDIETSSASLPAVVGDRANNRIIISGRQHAAPNYLRLLEVDAATKAVANKGVWGTQTVGTFMQSTTRTFGGNHVIVMYGASGGVYTETYLYNAPPAEPTIALSPAVFAAEVGTQIAITHNDADQMSAWAFYRQVGTVKEWWNNTTKMFDKTSEWFNTGSGFSVTIPATDNAGDWTTGNVYQLRSATKDSQGVVGPYNSTAVMANVGAAPQVAITSPATAASGTYTAEITVDVPISATRWRVLDGVTVASDTGKMPGATYLLTVDTPVNGKVYVVEVTVWDLTSGGGVASTPTTKAVTVSFTPPAIPPLNTSVNSAGGFIGVTWTSPTPTGTQPTVSYVDLYRRVSGGAFARIVTQLPASGTYPDYAAASGVTYEYKVTAVGTNATTSDSNTASAGVVFTSGVWLHDPLDPVGTAHFFQYREVNLSDSPKLASGEFQFVGRALPVVNFDAKAMTRELKLRLALMDGTSDRAAVEGFFYRRNTLCLRDFKGRKVYGVLRELTSTDEKWGSWLDLNLLAVDYRGDVV